MTEKALYQDAELKVDYYGNHDEYGLWIRNARLEAKGGSQEGNLNYMPRGVLEDLARTPRGEIVSKIETFNSKILFYLKEARISVDALHIAICQAYIEEEKRMA